MEKGKGRREEGVWKRGGGGRGEGSYGKGDS